MNEKKAMAKKHFIWIAMVIAVIESSMLLKKQQKKSAALADTAVCFIKNFHCL